MFLTTVWINFLPGQILTVSNPSVPAAVANSGPFLSEDEAIAGTVVSGTSEHLE